MFTKSDSSKNLQIENQSLSCQVSTLVTTWPSFRLLPIWLQTTLVAINSESCQTLFQSFCLPPSEVAVLFYSNLRLSRLPVLGQVACRLQPIWRQTLVAIISESCQTLFPSFCAQPSEVAVLFHLNLSRLPFLRQVVDLDLLLCTGFDLEHAVLFLCHIFTQRPTNDCKIERSDGRGFGGNNFQPIPMDIPFPMKKICRHGPISTKH